MPEFTTVSVTEAQLRTMSGRQKTYLPEYADYIHKLPTGQAGRLTIGENEKPGTIRRRLFVAAQTLGIPLIIKRSGKDLYFWREDGEAEQPRPRRGRRPRAGRPGDLIPPDLLSETEAGVQERTQEETTAPDQPLSASEEVDHEAALEESPELGQTDQVVKDAMRRVDPE
jgi:hypothetical protein